MTPSPASLAPLLLAGLVLAGCAQPSAWRLPLGMGLRGPAPAATSATVAKPPEQPPAPVVEPAAAKPAPASEPFTIRGQSPGGYTSPYDTAPGSTDYTRGPMPVSGAPSYNPAYPQPAANYASNPALAPAAPPGGFASPNPYLQPPTTTFQPGVAQPGVGPYVPPSQPLPPPPGFGPSGIPQPPIAPPSSINGGFPPFAPPSVFQGAPEYIQPELPTAPLDIFVEETRTGRFMFGVTVNSDAGVTGQVTIDERNFDITRIPTSWDDFANGTAFRGNGQGFRLEAQPGSQVQRYLVSFTNPYFLDTNVSFSASGFYFDRNYFDWSESRYGGRLAWGYRLTPDLSASFALRAENVNLFNPRVNTVAELNDALGRTDIFSGKISLTHDTRDLPFLPTEGHLIDVSFEQAFGDYDYPRGEIDYNQYFMLSERPDGTGRHTLAFSTKLGFSGSQTPIFENYFAGGFSTLRGYSFRGASPVEDGVRVGGEFRFLNSVEYFFPLTADDMIKGTVFVDFGTVERDIALRGDNFRVAPGVGLRINVPALGPAPLALDFAFPVASAATDDRQTFSFFFGLSRQ